MARRIHLFPFRTQKLSFLTPKVVRGTPLVRIGSCHADYSGIAQLVEHLTVNQAVDGSSPPAGVFLYYIEWPVGQVVKTPPFHGGNMGSNPVRVINGGLAQLGEHLPYKQGVTGSNPVSSIFKRSYGVGVITPACHAGDRRFKSG